ncbi:probable glutamate receptor [Cherax quadricarinatus]|uniref:probable glutamate receptor n=1 Tax=Cherax quadricarinatus TaxID=27406 RepID=UPI00237894CB|nr:probable glutamate receptor [Cherax quadricarinatus]
MTSSVIHMQKNGIPTQAEKAGLKTQVKSGLTSHVMKAGLAAHLVNAALIIQVLEDVLVAGSHESYSVIFFTDGSTSPSTVFMINDHLKFPGVSFFEVMTIGLDINKEKNFCMLLDQVKLLRQVSSYTTVVVVTDDLTFLAAFLKCSLKGRVLVWSTRLLIITRTRLVDVQDLQAELSKLNSMMLIISDYTTNIRCNIYIHLPYSPRGSQVLQVAHWAPSQGLIFTSNLPLFPDKYSKFFRRPHLLVAVEETAFSKLIKGKEPGASKFLGSLPQMIDQLSKVMNFTYSFVRPPDGVWGVKLKNGSWSGMVGMVMREEVSIGAGPFMVDRWRAEVVDFTVPILIDYWRILGARGLPEVDPWSFLFPMSPTVWVAIIVALMVLAASLFLMSSCFFLASDYKNKWLSRTFDYIRILLQQDMTVPICYWWERMLLVVWMMITLVITRSYSGNLMALLAVRHIPQPYQSLRDVMDDSSVTVIWEKDSASVPYLKSANSGIYREVADAEKTGRLIWRTHSEFAEALDTLVRRGDHVLIDVDNAIRSYIAQDFTKTGQCSFYESREEFLLIMLSMIGQKDSPLVPALSKRIMWMTEAGLFFQWLVAEEPNSTVCYRTSSKITVNAALSLTNISGMFVIILVGYFTSLFVFFIELLIPCSRNF